MLGALVERWFRNVSVQASHFRWQNT